MTLMEIAYVFKLSCYLIFTTLKEHMLMKRWCVYSAVIKWNYVICA